MPAIARNNVRVCGRPDGDVIMFAHGFGCDQSMWRFVTPEFERDHRVVVFDHVGFGGSDLTSWSPARYGSLDAYAEDLLEIVAELGLERVVFVGHSVSSMIGMLAALEAPESFRALVMVGPSPCYIDDGDYVGGFTAEDIEGLLDALDSNYLGWSAAMAPVIMGNPERPVLGQELTNSFCRTDPAVAALFARVTFLSDNRADLSRVRTPTLVLQCSDDPIAPAVVGDYVHRHIAGSEFVQLAATGHCPNLSAPEETSAAVRAFLARPAARA
jgi:sigma-B regulation protein RsbQ